MKIKQCAAVAVLAIGVTSGVAASPAGAVNPTYPRGYVTDAYLRAQPTTAAASLARIRDQWVDLVCWTTGQYANGTAKWFRASYYNTTGYLNANVVSHQPTVGPC